ncbi:odorant receptor 33b-like [Hermetia illucens]|nr:odorant receptor 33b-like [Hermetia illucens]
MTNDLIGPLYFIMLNAHLKIVIERIQGVGWNRMKTKEENCRELLECIEDHRLIMKMFDVLESNLSFAMFTQFASTAITVAMELMFAIFYPFSFTQISMLLVSAFSSALEILPCCYYSNDFMVQTNGIVTAIYSSNFYEQSKEFQKTMIIFMQMTQKAKVVSAGKMFPVTLATFASIMKTSYTLLTVASQLR